MKTPYASRPKRALFIAVGKLVTDDAYLEMTRDEFVDEVMKLTRGGANPYTAAEVYFALMRDAGIGVAETN